MLDHVIIDLIAAIRSAFEEALLERQAIEERFQVDVFLGDLSWETSYSLPGEGSPPRIRADVTLDWPTWSQSTYRSWSIGETPEEIPEAILEISLRIQSLTGPVEPDIIFSTLSEVPPPIGTDTLEKTGLTLEQSFSQGRDQPDQIFSRTAIEITYEGSFHLTDEVLSDLSNLDRKFFPLGRWIASTLVRLGDLTLPFDTNEESELD